MKFWFKYDVVVYTRLFIVLSRTCANCSRDSYRNFQIKMTNLFSPAKWWFAMPQTPFKTQHAVIFKLLMGTH